MKALIQRVKSAAVTVEDEIVGSIDQGLLVFLGVEKDDDEQAMTKLAHKLINYRVFADENNKMNLSVSDISGGVLIVSQFTLAANTTSGMRPSFSSAAPPVIARDLYEKFVERLKGSITHVATGVFAADMQVSLINDGPVTFLLES